MFNKLCIKHLMICQLQLYWKMFKKRQILLSQIVLSTSLLFALHEKFVILKAIFKSISQWYLRILHCAVRSYNMKYLNNFNIFCEAVEEALAVGEGKVEDV